MFGEERFLIVAVAGLHISVFRDIMIVVKLLTLIRNIVYGYNRQFLLHY